MDRKMIVAVLITAIVFGAVGFGGGMMIGKKSASPGVSGRMMGANGTPGGFPGQDAQSGGGNFSTGNVAVGKVTDKDDKSFTLKLADGSTRVVYYSSSTTFSKTETVTAGDVSVDTTVSAMGTATSGGDLTATRVTIGEGIGFGGRGMMGGGGGQAPQANQ